MQNTLVSLEATTIIPGASVKQEMSFMKNALIK